MSYELAKVSHTSFFGFQSRVAPYVNNVEKKVILRRSQAPGTGSRTFFFQSFIVYIYISHFSQRGREDKRAVSSGLWNTIVLVNSNFGLQKDIKAPCSRYKRGFSSFNLVAL